MLPPANPTSERVDLAHAVEDALLGAIADRARVDEHHVGVVEGGRTRVAGTGEDGTHNLCVRHVHLAAVRFDVDAAAVAVEKRRGDVWRRGRIDRGGLRGRLGHEVAERARIHCRVLLLAAARQHQHTRRLAASRAQHMFHYLRRM